MGTVCAHITVGHTDSQQVFSAATVLPTGKKYHVNTTEDLFPVEQPDIVQVIIGEDLFKSIQSADARACVSLCRPETQLTQTRQLTKSGKVMPTMLHQAGDLPLQSLTIEQDQARGYYTNMAATEEFHSSHLKLRKEEHSALPKVFAWLETHNPWVAAYKHSVQSVQQTWEELRAHLEKTGLTKGLEKATTRRGQHVVDELGAEQLAMLVPLGALDAPSGTYQALRAAADTIATSSLRMALPPEWEELHENPSKDRENRPLSYLPDLMDKN